MKIKCTRRWLGVVASTALVGAIAGRPALAAGDPARPGVAVLLPPDSAPLREAFDWEWTLQDQVNLADPARMAATVREHPFVLTAKTTAADLIALSKYVDADYLLAVMPGDATSTVRAVRLVGMEDQKLFVDARVAVVKDPYLVAAAAREQMTAALDPAAHGPAADPKAEIAYWRNAARQLMPRSDYRDSRTPFDVLTDEQRTNCHNAIRAWENVLVLDEKDNEATLNLGVCLVSLVRFDVLNGGKGRPETPEKKLAIPLMLRGSKLAEAALVQDDSAFNAASFQQVAAALAFGGPKCQPLMERMAEMDQFLLDHPKLFKDFEITNAHLRLAQNPQRLPKELEAAVHPADGKLGDAYVVASLFMTLANSYPDAEGAATRMEIATPYLKDKDPLTQFFAEYVMGEALFRDRHDPAALQHFDRMLALHDDAFAALKRSENGMAQKTAVDSVYRYRYVACDVLGKPDEARETVLKGVKYFMAAGRFNDSAAWCYYFAVTNVLKDDPKAALPIADFYIKAKAANNGMDKGDEAWLREVIEYQKAHQAKPGNEK